jgi:hypothetical protein
MKRKIGSSFFVETEAQKSDEIQSKKAKSEMSMYNVYSKLPWYFNTNINFLKG